MQRRLHGSHRGSSPSGDGLTGCQRSRRRGRMNSFAYSSCRLTERPTSRPPSCLTTGGGGGRGGESERAPVSSLLSSHSRLSPADSLGKRGGWGLQSLTAAEVKKEGKTRGEEEELKLTVGIQGGEKRLLCPCLPEEMKNRPEVLHPSCCRAVFPATNVVTWSCGWLRPPIRLPALLIKQPHSPPP